MRGRHERPDLSNKKRTATYRGSITRFAVRQKEREVSTREMQLTSFEG